MNRLIHLEKGTPLLLAKGQILFLIMLLCVAIAGVQSVHAATIFVTNTMDSGLGSLRQALANANDGDKIKFHVTGTIFLTSGQLVVDKSVTISGPRANLLTVDANHNSRVFLVNPGLTVTISGLTITNGNAGNFDGGGIYNDHATLMVNNSSVSGNSAGDGGGIFNYGFGGSATLSINNSTVSGNTVTGGGGGISNSDGVTVNLNDGSQVTKNTAGLVGGGISGFGTINLNDSSNVNHNTADVFGGGIALFAATVNLNNRSNVSKNTATMDGGGIYIFAGTVNLNNSSNVNKNTATRNGGGIFIFTGTVNLNDSSNANWNIATNDGGGIYNAAGTVNQNGGSVLHNNPNNIAP